MKKILAVNSSGYVGGAEKILLGFLSNIDRGVFALSAMVPSRGKLCDILHERSIEYDVADGLYINGFVTRDDSFASKPASTVKSILSLLRFSGQISEKIKKTGADIVLCNGIKASLAGGMAAKRAGIKSAWMIQDILPANLYAKVFFSCAGLFPEKILAISASVKGMFPERLRYKVETVRPFLDDSELADVGRARSLRSELNIGQDEVVLGMIGKLLPSKGIDILLESLFRIRKEGGKVRLLVVGDAELETSDKDYPDRLKKLVRSLSADGNVLFLGWRDNIYDLYKTIDLLVSTSSRPEGFGRVIIEAMACSRATIAFDHGAAREIIADGISGILVKPYDRQDLLNKLAELIRDRARIRLLGEAAGKRFEEYFNSPDSKDLFGYILKAL